MDDDMYRDCHPDDVARIADVAMRFAKNSGPYNIIYRTKVKGNYKIIHAYAKHIFKGSTRLAVVWYVDEGDYSGDFENKEFSLMGIYSGFLNDSLITHESSYDFLTGLPTISYFFSLTEGSFKRDLKAGKNSAMLFFDLTGMKYFNFKYGFAEGNNLIRAFSRLLVETFTHSCCCRFGMDRFCVYTDDIDLEERLWSLFGKCENLNDGKVLPVRAGIYTLEMGKCEVSVACDRAKMACDSSKKVYVSHFTYFDDSMLADSEKRQYIIDNLDRAISEKWIQVYYQPIIRSANGRVCDEEALSRWIDPKKGLLSPADFIPILEDANLIYKLDLYVTEEILKKMKAQSDAGLYIVPTSVNLSRSDFDSCDIVEEIHKRITDAGIAPEKLTIEITESIIGNDYDYMKSQIERFQSLGFKVWMDDFGSGYSSLDLLQKLKFNLIKLDMKFMQEFSENEKSRIILSELIRMALALEIETVCEGVETEEQVEFLKEIGCTKLQGFYYCKPIPAEEIFRRYETGIQIGFENPAESDYYSHLGKINLYDLSVVTNGDEEIFENFFNTLPMAVMEQNENKVILVRGNKSYREFLRKYFPDIKIDKKLEFSVEKDKDAKNFIDTALKCRKCCRPIIVDEVASDGTKMHIYFRRIAVNPVTKVAGFVMVILSTD